jgi:hypothetical protein
MVHGRNDGGNASRVLGEKECCILVLLQKRVSTLVDDRYETLTSKTVMRSSAMAHSSVSSSNFWSLRDLSTVMASMVAQHLIAKLSI